MGLFVAQFFGFGPDKVFNQMTFVEMQYWFIHILKMSTREKMLNGATLAGVIGSFFPNEDKEQKSFFEEMQDQICDLNSIIGIKKQEVVAKEDSTEQTAIKLLDQFSKIGKRSNSSSFLGVPK